MVKGLVGFEDKYTFYYKNIVYALLKKNVEFEKLFLRCWKNGFRGVKMDFRGEN